MSTNVSKDLGQQLDRESDWTKMLHHWRLLNQYWWAASDVKQYAILWDGRKVTIKDPPRFGRHFWRVKIGESIERISSASINLVSGSLVETGK